ncbi:MAG: histidine phosphatase family protein [Pseudonocardiaceae bacterium]|nr:histidine phosphatase family protein [Pseudonocardiaceae bacterium]
MGAVYLVRHGQASFGAADYDKLSELGMRQSTALGAVLRQRGTAFARVISGTMRRQRHTAELAVAEAGIEVPCEQDERWNEYDHVGVVGKHGNAGGKIGSTREFQRVLEASLRAWIDEDSACPETWAVFRGRVEEAFGEVIDGLGSGERALVFTSGGVISAVCAGLLGGSPEAFMALNRVAVNAGVTKLVTGRSGVSLVSYNEHAHFEGDAGELLTYR